METIKYLSVEEWINNTILLSYREIVLIVNIGKMTEQELHWLTWTNIKTLITICKLDPNSSCTLKRPHSRKCSFLHEQIFHFYWIIPMSMQFAILIHSFFQKKKRLFIYFWLLCWVFVAACGLSQWGHAGAPLHGGAWVSHCGGSSVVEHRL